MQSTYTDGAFRRAARRLCRTDMSVPEWAAVSRPADGGAFVEVSLFVPDAEARRDENTGDAHERKGAAS